MSDENSDTSTTELEEESEFSFEISDDTTITTMRQQIHDCIANHGEKECRKIIKRLRDFELSYVFYKVTSSIKEGKYFATMSQLWGSEVKGAFPSNHHEYQQLNAGRDAADFQKGDNIVLANRFQEECMANLIEAFGDATIQPVAKESHNRTSIQSSEKKKLWPANVITDQRVGDIAHFLKHGYTIAVTCWFLPPWLYADTDNEEGWSWNKRMKALVGVVDQSSSKRKNFTGILHHVSNKARIYGQRTFMDDNPCFIIVPILTVEEARNWKGEPYSAIVLNEAHGDYDISTVASGTCMASYNKTAPYFLTANDEEIGKATGLLRFFLRAMFTATRSDNKPDDVPKSVESHVNEVANLSGVVTPIKKDTTNLIVRKISFTTHNTRHGEDIQGHPAPDPLLLTVKACSIFSKLHNQKIIVGAEPKEDNWDEMDYIDLENFIEYQESLLKPPSDWDNLAKQLGQTGARCPDDWDNGTVKNTISLMQKT